jgi:hypothetical protein
MSSTTRLLTVVGSCVHYAIAITILFDGFDGPSTVLRQYYTHVSVLIARQPIGIIEYVYEWSNGTVQERKRTKEQLATTSIHHLYSRLLVEINEYEQAHSIARV